MSILAQIVIRHKDQLQICKQDYAFVVFMEIQSLLSILPQLHALGQAWNKAATEGCSSRRRRPSEGTQAQSGQGSHGSGHAEGSRRGEDYHRRRLLQLLGVRQEWQSSRMQPRCQCACRDRFLETGCMSISDFKLQDYKYQLVPDAPLQCENWLNLGV